MATLVDYDPARHADALRELWTAYVAEVAVSLREEAGLAVDPPAVAARLLALNDGLRPPTGRLLLAVDGDAVVGSGAVRVIAPGVAEVERMYLRPAARGRGLGRAILAELLATARGLGCREVRLDTGWFMTDAHRLYRAAGFVECAPFPDFEARPELAARWVYMTLDLTAGAAP
jgi:GNAT superfamily N-acetyltransferase